MDARDLAAVVDVVRVGRQGAGEVDRSVDPFLAQKATGASGSEIGERADDFAVVVEP
jgi:hypothetical protein